MKPEPSAPPQPGPTLAGRILRGLAVPVAGTFRYAATLALVCGLWWYDARWLNEAFDANLSLIKTIGSTVDSSGRVEAAMRAFAAEKMLLFTEASAVVWGVGRSLVALVAYVFASRRSASMPRSSVRSLTV